MASGAPLANAAYTSDLSAQPKRAAAEHVPLA